MRRILDLYVQNRNVLVLTFEVFWIVVFLLDRYASGSASDVAQFVYVNF